MQRLGRHLLALLGLAIAAALQTVNASTSASSAANGGWTLQPCRIEHPDHLASVEAECGTLEVLENPADANSRQISLYVARVPAISRRKQKDPLFVLAGGPGMAASTFYAGAAPAFARIRRDRDIILVDQRGTGRSNGLICAFDESEMWRGDEEEIVTETKRCLESFTNRADVRFYTTSLAVQDLDRVREAFGYERINLYGVSYGTRVAQHYARRFPERTRTMILDGVVPPQVALGPRLALDAEAALEKILGRCKADASCNKEFGDPHTTYRKLRAKLAKQPVQVQLADPTTGKPRELEFSDLHLATVLRLGSYTSEQAAVLPLSLHLADREGNFVPLASQFLLISEPVEEQIAYGMHNTVVCSEDVPFFDSTQIDRAKLEETYLGTSQLDTLQRICDLWPRGPVDEDFHQPLHANVPTLLMSGSADPVTPPENAELARSGLTASVHIVLDGLGHGQLAAPCVDRVMAQFVERGTTQNLDTHCTRRARPMPFFTTLAGPAP